MDLLPPADERESLLDSLAELVERQGFKTLVGAPIVEPRAAYFPDAWEPNAHGVATLARRLLAYAGLEELDVEVLIYADEDDYRSVSSDGRTQQSVHQGAAAWFGGIHDGVCVFGADARQLATPESLVGVMSHEIAHAYRAYHDLVEDDRDLEEQLTDLTTVYLGFGLMTTNNAYRYRASGGFEETRWSHTRTGYLSPQAMSFLLAAQLVARSDRRVRGRIRRQLETNQRACFQAACKILDADALPTRLGLPDRERWPRVPRVADLAPLREIPRPPPEIPSGEPAPPPEPVRFNAGRPVFRVIRAHAELATGAALLVGGLVGLFLRPLFGLPPAAGISLVIAAPLAGFLIGRRMRRDFCSDPDCATRLQGDEVVCPGCGGDIRGTITHVDRRLEAEEALELSGGRGDD